MLWSARLGAPGAQRCARLLGMVGNQRLASVLSPLMVQLARTGKGG